MNISFAARYEQFFFNDSFLAPRSSPSTKQTDTEIVVDMRKNGSLKTLAGSLIPPADRKGELDLTNLKTTLSNLKKETGIFSINSTPFSLAQFLFAFFLDLYEPCVSVLKSFVDRSTLPTLGKFKPDLVRFLNANVPYGSGVVCVIEVKPKSFDDDVYCQVIKYLEMMLKLQPFRSVAYAGLINKSEFVAFRARSPLNVEVFI